MLLNILIFMIILLVYLHIYYHLKVSNDLEIFEHEISNKNNLEEILNLRQPVVINYNRQNLDTIFTLDNIYKKYHNTQLNLRKNDISNELVDKSINRKRSMIDFKTSSRKYTVHYPYSITFVVGLMCCQQIHYY